ncbi:predicted protein [Histoplasma mississippiense (nom. inval.)]|uniref:predicted protein n=1 Tax=Ajellomyces capsulatus (strain NAm1 / WU24) TaxID=2059318 RepID=UPI000157D15E|nr:predicted protein [Histoplasma mississippiense (nom. inval.)]EDN11094.1 predicted protein [Histoplasma mississippiense (nom. inval.)]
MNATPQRESCEERDPTQATAIQWYEAQFDDPAPSEMWQPPKRRKMSNLETVLETANQEIHNIFKAEHARREALEEEVQNLHTEMTRKNELVDKLETEVRELKHQCRCQIWYTIPSGWRTLLCGHRYCPECAPPPIDKTCGTCRQVVGGNSTCIDPQFCVMEDELGRKDFDPEWIRASRDNENQHQAKITMRERHARKLTLRL